MPTLRIKLLAGALVLVGLGAEAADDAASSPARAGIERVKALRAQRPGDGSLVYYQALLHAGLGEKDRAVAELKSLVGRRLGLIPVRDIGFAPLWDDAAFQQVRAELIAEEPRTPDAPVAFRLRDARLIPEGIAYDATQRRFYVGSIAGRKIVVRDDKGRERDFSRGSDRLDTVLGFAVDTKRRQLLAVSTNGFEDSAKLERRNALMRYDLKTGRLIERLPVPDAQQLNDVAIAPDGAIYVTDSAAGSVFRLRPGESRLSVLGTAGAVRGANGIAASADGRLYATLSTGIARIDTATGEVTRLHQPDTVMTGGIDGLYWHDGDLIGVQNSTNPGRVIRIALTDQGTRIEGVTVLQSHHHPEFAEPTTGAIAKDKLHVIANSHVGHYEPNGTIKDEAKLRPTAIVAVPLRRG
jgi:hypothetical protein